MINRRDTLLTLAAATPAIMLGNPKAAPASDRVGEILPLRSMGNTGISVTMLGLGGAHINRIEEAASEATIEAAVEGGVRFFDNAEGYGRGKGEIKYGKYLTPKYRDVSFIMTKTAAKDAATAQKHLDGSLANMKTDYIDLWQIHNLKTAEDVDTRIDGGVLDVFLKAKESGKAKYIGFTGHTTPEALLRMLERTRGQEIFSACQMPINICDPGYNSFIKQVMPELLKRNIAPLAMKTLAGGRFFGKHKRKGKVWETDDPVVPGRVSLADTQNFVWSLPVATLITGAETPDQILEKIAVAKTFSQLDEAQRNAIVSKVEDIAATGETEFFKT
jgi:aryl-alcohol dehydrogenase-like predicted oxidoreductase